MKLLSAWHICSRALVATGEGYTRSASSITTTSGCSVVGRCPASAELGSYHRRHMYHSTILIFAALLLSISFCSPLLWLLWFGLHDPHFVGPELPSNMKHHAWKRGATLIYRCQQYFIGASTMQYHLLLSHPPCNLIDVPCRAGQPPLPPNHCTLLCAHAQTS